MATNRSKLNKATRTALETYLWTSLHYYKLKHEPHPGTITNFYPRSKSHRPYHLDEIEEAASDLAARGMLNPTILNQKSSVIMSAINQLIIKTKLDDPTPSSPVRPPVINLTITTSLNKFYQWNFSAIYAARRAIDYLIGDRTFKWLDDNTITIYSSHIDKSKVINVTVTTDHPPDGLSDIMEHTFTQREQNFPLSPDHMRIGHDMFIHPNTTSPTIIKIAKDATPKPTKPTKPPPTDLIQLSTLLSDTDITAKEARVALRKLSLSKPTGRWEFPTDAAPTIKKQIVAAVTKARKR